MRGVLGSGSLLMQTKRMPLVLSELELESNFRVLDPYFYFYFLIKNSINQTIICVCSLAVFPSHKIILARKFEPVEQSTAVCCEHTKTMNKKQIKKLNKVEWESEKNQRRE